LEVDLQAAAASASASHLRFDGINGHETRSTSYIARWAIFRIVYIWDLIIFKVSTSNLQKEKQYCYLWCLTNAKTMLGLIFNPENFAFSGVTSGLSIDWFPFVVEQR
jgi:hypothetical protein